MQGLASPVLHLASNGCAPPVSAVSFPQYTMPAIKHKFLITMFAVVLVSAATFAFALPGPTACLLIGLAELHKLSDGSLTKSESEVDQQRYIQLTRDARARIESTFGVVESQPILVFFDQPDRFGPFSLNAYGSTQFIGSRACVMVGPKGQNVDVVAHELMHAEIHHRVGYLKRFLQLPTWFDEGVAMQVDYRSRYSLSPQDALQTAFVRDLTTYSTFFKGDDQALTRNYASAKHEVASWLSKVASTSLYSRFQRIRDGQSFAEAIAE
jgi:hypothetical protein